MRTVTVNDYKKQNILSPNFGPTPENSHLANPKRTANNFKNLRKSIILSVQKVSKRRRKIEEQ